MWDPVCVVMEAPVWDKVVAAVDVVPSETEGKDSVDATDTVVSALVAIGGVRRSYKTRVKVRSWETGGSIPKSELVDEQPRERL